MIPKIIAANVVSARTAAPEADSQTFIIRSRSPVPSAIASIAATMIPKLIARAYPCQLYDIDNVTSREGGSLTYSPVYGMWISISGSTRLLKLESAPLTPKPDRRNRNKLHPRILSVHRYISLSQEVAEIGECLPPSV